MGKCTAITRGGGRCKGVAIDASGLCYSHHPDHEQARRQAARKGGKRGGRGRPQAELSDLKRRLSDLADDVLEGKVNRSSAAVAGQILNTYIRAVAVELKAREQMEITDRLEELEAHMQEKGARWGTRSVG